MTYSVIRCTSRAETAAAARLERLGYPGAWWPTDEVPALSGAKTRAVQRAGEKPPVRIVPVIPGYVFVEGEVDIYRVRSAPDSKLWMAALIVNGQPVTIPDDQMSMMKQIPERLEQHMAEIQAKLEAERAARAPRLGELAVLVDGYMAGRRGIVIGIQGGAVKMEMNDIALGHFIAPAHMVERVG